ncbi:hypothetical protein FisN_17Lh037 [Fistulifera solaris]|uniref:SPX domain-containing protein n=1 Tax=Fistulifera solaris TaxID=1519565 RepID=A0A1Z5J5S4_FISSO|nr:hypothetical protein FisN_17Lh037 [Fistulifera solaris]|eukprot:GAX09289.1 hypothetical protein FisN_17Lh037 [Fistulifera solaris]
MVGFGSSLRMARRPGWEGAYLDYETLKLLLSQIESIYEEEAQRPRDDGVFLRDGSRKERTERDFRVDLFLESDSDNAYPSADEERPEGSRHLKVIAERQPGAFISTPGRSFAVTYSDDINSSSDDDERVQDAGCGGALASWVMNTKAERITKEGQPLMQRQNPGNAIASSSYDSEDYYISNPKPSNGDAFILEGREEDNPESSILSAPVRRAHIDERSSLLAASSIAHSGKTAFPPATFSSEESNDRSFSPVLSPVPLYYTTGPTINPLTPNVSRQLVSQMPNNNPNTNRKLQEERERERRARRERRKRTREDKVPRRLRRAHAKARAITERFIGLLYAECEKVELFALARLGELVETAGSLRFPSFDDEYGSFQHNSANHGENVHYLSDRGLHPSDSSSSGERLNSDGQGIFPWSDSSDGDADSHGTERAALPSTFSGDSVGLKVSPRSRLPTVPDISLSLVGKKVVESSDTIRQQIAHFTALRHKRPIFQRNELVLGEDMLFLSAGEEVDGYTSVGVELLHVLRFICVNLVAVRKICRKHDRLLLNRMLGGYYQRLGVRSNVGGRLDTLGESVSRASQKSEKVLLGFFGNTYKLVGKLDHRIQHLANSQTVRVISSCLSSALSEYEISRSRADAMTKLNSGTFTSVTPLRAGGVSMASLVRENHSLRIELEKTDEAYTSDAPSTSSSIALTRLEYTVTAIHALREAAREKHGYFSSYVSRSCVSFCGYYPPCEGLDGCSRETLDFLVAYNPDLALLHNVDVLFEGLTRGKWRAVHLEELFASTIVASLIPEQTPLSTAKSMMAQEFDRVARALGLKSVLSDEPFESPKGHEVKVLSRRHISSLPREVFILSRWASFLYMLNYFVAHATSNIFVMSTGSSSALAATIIGVPNVAAMLVTFFHCLILSNQPNSHRQHNNARLLRGLFALASFFAIIGNIVHAHAINIGSIRLAILGRFVFGLSTTEILQRQLLFTSGHRFIVSESASLVISRIAGTISGLFLGACIEALPLLVNSLDVRFLRAGNWLLIVTWLLLLIAVCMRFRELEYVALKADSHCQGAVDAAAQRINDGSSSESDSPNPSRMLYGAERADLNDDLLTTLVKAKHPSIPSGHDSYQSKHNRLPGTPKKKRSKNWRNFVVRIRKLLDFHIGIPVSLFVLFVASFCVEAFFTGTPLVTNEYFGWDGAQASSFLGFLSCTTFLIHWICERVSRGYEDRIVIKNSIGLVAIGLFVTINWVSIIYLATRYSILLEETEHGHPHVYDWTFGVLQYIIGLCLIHAGGKALESASLSMLSKFSPVNIRSVVINVGTIATFLTSLARLLADLQVSMIGLSNKLINTDMVNSLSLPLLLACLAVMLVVRRHFFSLL